MSYFVYVLVDPRTNVVHYVGMTTDPNRRFTEHVTQFKKVVGRKRNDWVKSLLSIGVYPEMKILEVVETWWEANIQEKYWIQNYTGQGIALVNALYITSKQTLGTSGDISPEGYNSRMDDRKRGPKPRATPPGYERYGRALELFHPLDKNTFNYRVRTGDIYVEKDEYGKLYEERSIQRVKEHLLGERDKELYTGDFLIDWTLPSDFPSGIKLDMQVYNLDIALADATTYQSWRKNNNNRLSIAAFSADRSVRYASIKLIPVRDEQIAIDILSKKRSENDLQADEIRGYDEPGPYIILAIDAVALPEYPYLLNRILRKWMDFWIEQYPDRYMKRIYTQAMSESGYRMVQHFFMSPRFDLAPNAFMLDMAYPSASRIVRHLQERLKEKSPLPPDLQPPL